MKNIAVILNTVQIEGSSDGKWITVPMQGEELTADQRSMIERAVSLGKTSDGHVTVFLSGYKEQRVLLREALAMGCDDAVLLTSDWASVCRHISLVQLLSRTLYAEQYDLIITGYRILDGFTSPIGSQIAAAMNIPFIPYVSDVTFDKGKVLCMTEYENESYRISASCPAFITLRNLPLTNKTITVMDIQNAFEKPLLETEILINPEIYGRDICWEIRVDHQMGSGRKCLMYDEIPVQEAAQHMMDHLIERGIV